MPNILETLLALNGGNLPPLPAPAAPLPLMPAPAPPISVGPAFGASPELMASDVAPGAPAPPLDMNFVNNYAGPAPVAPVQRQPSKLELLGAILSGIGSGPEYGAYLREQRQQPQREYQRQQEQYQQRRSQGLELATRSQERQQDRLTRQAEIKADRDFEIYKQSVAGNDKLAQQQLEQAHEMAKFQMQQRMLADKQAEEEKAAKAKQRNQIYADLVKNPTFAPTKVANEIADNIVFGKPMSPATEKWRSIQVDKAQAQIDKLSRPTTGGGVGKPMAKLDDGSVIPVSLVDKKNGIAIVNGQKRKVVDYVGGGTSSAQPQQGKKSDPLGIR